MIESQFFGCETLPLSASDFLEQNASNVDKKSTAVKQFVLTPPKKVFSPSSTKTASH
jgi:hypothetical protein